MGLRLVPEENKLCLSTQVKEPPGRLIIRIVTVEMGVLHHSVNLHKGIT